MDTVQDSRQRAAGAISTVDLIGRLSRFDGPPEEFLVNLLAVQCHVAGAAGGVILRVNIEGGAEVVAIYPVLEEGATAPVWLAQSVESAPAALSGGTTAIRPLRMPDELYGAPSRRHLVMVPLRSGSGVRGLAAFVLETDDPKALAAGRERLELTVSLLSFYEMRLTLQRRQTDLARLRQGMEALSAVNEHRRFKAAAMAMCNEVAAGWSCERVSLGFLKGRYIHLGALSHVEKFSRKMKLVQDIEAAMEECLDQDLEIVHPAPADAVSVTRATAGLAARHGPTTVVSLPLRRGGDPVAVLTVERAADRPFELEDIEGLRLTCDLCIPRLADLHEQDRWFGARLASVAKKGLAAAVGPKHTWAKVAAVAIFAALFFLTFVHGEHRVEAPFVLQAVNRCVVQPPFDGELAKVYVEAPQKVAEKEKLAELSIRRLEGELKQAKAKLTEYQKQALAARAERKWVDEQIALAGVKGVREEIKNLSDMKTKATLRSPIDGWVVKGDLKPHVHAWVETHEVLFEVVTLRPLRAELSVSEDMIADVIRAEREAREEGQEVKGKLATARYPNRKIEFTVERITPVAQEEDDRSVFKVRVTLTDTPEWMWPGMEGVAKITVGREPYGWILGHRLINWVRMKLWL